MKIKKRHGKRTVTSSLETGTSRSGAYNMHSSRIRYKKAMESTTMVFYYAACLFFAFFVIFTYMRIAYTGAKSTKFNMEFFVNDVGLMTDSLSAVPGDVDYDYKKSPSKFIFDFRESALYVYTPIETANVKLNKEGISDTWSSYNLLFEAGKPFVKKFTFPPIISFRKKGSMLEISSSGVFNDREFCPIMDTYSDLKQANITIEPGHYMSEPGYVSGNQKEFQLTEAIAESIAVLCRSHSMNCKILRQGTMAEKVAEMNTEPKPNMAISLHIGDYQNPDDNPFRAMYIFSSSKSEKLACLISNKFREDYIVLESEKIVPLLKYSQDYASILSENAPSVVLEIGNIRNIMGFDQDEDINKIAAIIVSGIEEYYKKEAVSAEGEEEFEELNKEMKGAKEMPADGDKSKVKVITR
ncbi:hypothetical protein COV19_06520 [Candidatus Woesearchaeota archaeon CG10_big_fil_rev_8_21_14_0_10_44_13]|nr:MAG: hypothetical protein COV19_06520 [Candidatus Woesearchaeota archaeon CG10_big_fil_rev_8_21_14_0_10_44_13]